MCGFLSKSVSQYTPCWHLFFYNHLTKEDDSRGMERLPATQIDYKPPNGCVILSTKHTSPSMNVCLLLFKVSDNDEAVEQGIMCGSSV